MKLDIEDFSDTFGGINEEDLGAYIDGTLPDDQIEQVESVLDQSPYLNYLMDDTESLDFDTQGLDVDQVDLDAIALPDIDFISAEVVETPYEIIEYDPIDMVAADATSNAADHDFDYNSFDDSTDPTFGWLDDTDPGDFQG